MAVRFGYMPNDASYYRARAMEERQRALEADRIYLRTIHRKLAEELDRRAAECDARVEEFEPTERPSEAIRERDR